MSMRLFGKRGDEPDPPALPEDLVVVVDRAINPYLVSFHDPTGFRAEQVRGLRNKLMAMNPEGSPGPWSCLRPCGAKASR